MRQIEIYNDRSTLWIRLDVQESATPASVYGALNEVQVSLVDRMFGMPQSKRQLAFTQRRLERAQNSVSFLHSRVCELNEKLSAASLEDGYELTERQMRIICALDEAERTLRRKRELLVLAEEAFREAQHAYTTDVDSFKVIIR